MKLNMKLEGEFETITGCSFMMLDIPGSSVMRDLIDEFNRETENQCSELLFTETGQFNTAIKLTLDGEEVIWENPPAIKDRQTVTMFL